MNMDNPTVEELISDQSFIDYCLQDDVVAADRWERWSQDDPTRKKLLDEAKQLVIALASRPTVEEISVERARLLRFLDQQESTHRRSLRRLATRRWIAAASIALAVGLGAMWYFRRPTAVDEASVALLKQMVPAGKLMNLRLADGTEVRLSSTSTFAYPAAFSDSIRVVQLQGEAFFDVAHDETKPFIIQTGDFSIRVLGTAFNVHAFEEEGQLQVSLFRGKVEVSNQQLKQLLAPGQAFVYNKDHKTFKVEPFDADRERERIEGTLFFDNADFPEVARQLRRKYGIEVQPNEGVHLAFSGTIQHETLEQVIEKLNFTTNYHFLLESNTLIVKQK